MGRVLGVSFAPHGRLFLLDAAGSDAVGGDAVLVPTESGLEVARCACVTDADGVRLPKLAGKATDADLARDAAHRARRAEIWAVASRLIALADLPMTVVGVDHVDDGRRRIAYVYFKAPHRVDFRGLLVELARVLGSRVDLRQVGDRDVAALLGGVGPCGRDLCCALVAPARRGVRVRGADEGQCGHARCCYAYEDGRGPLLRRRSNT